MSKILQLQNCKIYFVKVSAIPKGHHQDKLTREMHIMMFLNL